MITLAQQTKLNTISTLLNQARSGTITQKDVVQTAQQIIADLRLRKQDQINKIERECQGILDAFKEFEGILTRKQATLTHLQNIHAKASDIGNAQNKVNRANEEIKILHRIALFVFEKNSYFVSDSGVYYSEELIALPRDISWVAEKAVNLQNAHPDVFFPNNDEKGLKISKSDIFDIFVKFLSFIGHNCPTMRQTYDVLSNNILNTAPNPVNWIQPIFGKEPHEFFHLLFDTIFPDEEAKKNVLICLAWKYWRPYLSLLPCPVLAGVGGSGKTGLGRIFAAIFGKELISWKARLDNDGMLYTGSFTKSLICCFDEMEAIKPNSKEHAFIKNNVHSPTLNQRELYKQAIETNNHVWFWFSGNPQEPTQTTISSPLPLSGDNMGVDRRWTPSIIRKTLMETVMEKKKMSETEANRWLQDTWTFITSTPQGEEEIAKWLGYILTISNVMNLPDNMVPTAYHGPDYTQLIKEYSNQVTDIYYYLFEDVPKKYPEVNFISKKMAYLTYQAYCDECQVNKNYRKNRKNFSDAIDALVKKHATNWETLRGYRRGMINSEKGGKETTCEGWKSINFTGEFDIKANPPWLTCDYTGKVEGFDLEVATHGVEREEP